MITEMCQNVTDVHISCEVSGTPTSRHSVTARIQICAYDFYTQIINIFFSHAKYC